ncbi:hypothetical protein IAQ61_001310 [Plenodomus lingam]|uniref:uncharacterized protein n=1 Tax=Leptosphaeria maculans TaxID=5022 RepID=UPI003319A868|nr:hypothetical protein IAQ61_001310 [Plenodomus lingam]
MTIVFVSHPTSLGSQPHAQPPQPWDVDQPPLHARTPRHLYKNTFVPRSTRGTIDSHIPLLSATHLSTLPFRWYTSPPDFHLQGCSDDTY